VTISALCKIFTICRKKRIIVTTREVAFKVWPMLPVLFMVTGTEEMKIFLSKAKEKEALITSDDFDDAIQDVERLYGIK
jgi:hypothetical protein